MDAGISMVITSTAILGLSLFVAIVGLKPDEYELNIDIKKIITHKTGSGKAVKKKKRKK